MTTQVFAGNAAVAYAAFNLRDPYYQEMARLVIDAARARLGSAVGIGVDLGAGVGMSTMELRKDAAYVIAVEPEEGMRYFCGLNVMGDPQVAVVEGKGENLSETIALLASRRSNISALDDELVDPGVDAVLCCQVFHLFNPPDKGSLVPAVLQQIAAVLRTGGVFAFDLGPSNFEFATPLSNHRTGEAKRGEILTELSHPLYQRAHEIALRVVKREFPGFDRENLWPPAAARMSFEFLHDAYERAGLHDLEAREDFSPVPGRRVVNFIRNGWSVFFRWGPLAGLPSERKLNLMNEVLGELFREPNFEAMKTVMSYHPTAVFTAVKA